MSGVPWTLEEILPIRPPMVLISGVEAWTGDEVTVFVDIGMDSAFAEPDGVPAQIAIEYMAQACAAYSGCQAREAGHTPSVGFLLGTRNFQSSRAFFRPGERLRVIARTEYRDEEMGMFSCEIEIGGDQIASARISVFQAADGSLPGVLADD
jgi:predicted hotdog family 3-hydroxylacyl-ACP dehydratase